MIGLGGKKSMQYVLLEAQEAAERCVIIVVDELLRVLGQEEDQRGPGERLSERTVKVVN